MALPISYGASKAARLAFVFDSRSHRPPLIFFCVPARFARLSAQPMYAE
jgi:hypothetical protein